jgi:DNA modification methylase
MSPKNLIVWDKGTAGLGANYQNRHELVAFLHNYTQEQVADGAELDRPDITTTTGEANVWEIPRDQDKDIGDDLRDHFAKKPTKLPTRAIENSTQYGETVLDPFGGTGTTLIAAEQTGRRCVMLEADPSYCDTIVRRWERATGETAHQLDTPVGYVTHDPDDMETAGEAKRQRDASVNGKRE